MLYITYTRAQTFLELIAFDSTCAQSNGKYSNHNTTTSTKTETKEALCEIPSFRF